MPICEVCVDHNQLSEPIALNSSYWCLWTFLDLENVQHLEEGVAVMIASGRWQVIFPYIIKNRDPQNHFIIPVGISINKDMIIAAVCVCIYIYTHTSLGSLGASLSKNRPCLSWRGTRKCWGWTWLERLQVPKCRTLSTYNHYPFLMLEFRV